MRVSRLYVGVVIQTTTETTTHMKADLSTFPEQVRTFVQALIANAKEVEGWEVCDLEGGKCFADTIPYVKLLSDGRIQVCDNYEKFFDTIYTYTPSADESERAGKWEIRWMYADREPRSYTFEKCMADAHCMFTG